MNINPVTDLSRLCIHTITTKPWSIEESAKNYSAGGVKGITVWRDALHGQEYQDRQAKCCADMVCQWFLFAGEVSSLVR